MDERLLIQFAKVPVPGEVKTRMQPVLSADAACDLHCELLQWTASTLFAAQLGSVQLWLGGQGSHPVLDAVVARGATLHRQCGSDLGERMAYALAQGLRQARRVVLVGSDCPALSDIYLQQAFAALEHSPVVLGPALDGGYVLVACRDAVPPIFEGIGWGGADVLAATVARLDAAGVGYSLLEPLADVDRPADLVHWERAQQSAAQAAE